MMEAGREIVKCELGGKEECEASWERCTMMEVRRKTAKGELGEEKNP